MAKKKTCLDFMKMKKEGEQAAWVTAYDFPTASFVEQAGMDMILVGDSLGMVVLGYQGTIPVTMTDCVLSDFRSRSNKKCRAFLERG